MRPLQQWLCRSAAHSPYGCSQHKADTAKHRLGIRRRHTASVLTRLQIMQDVCDTRRRWSEIHRAPGRSSTQVTCNAQLDLLLRHELALSRRQTQADSGVQRVQGHLCRPTRRHEIYREVVVEEVVHRGGKEPCSRHTEQVRHAVEVEHRAGQAEGVTIHLVEEGSSSLNIPNSRDHVLRLRSWHAAIRREQVVQPKLDIWNRNASVDAGARQLIQNVRRKLRGRGNDGLEEANHLVRTRQTRIVDSTHLFVRRPALPYAKAGQDPRPQLPTARVFANKLRTGKRRAAKPRDRLVIGLRLKHTHSLELLGRSRSSPPPEQRAHVAEPRIVGSINRSTKLGKCDLVEFRLDGAIHPAIRDVANGLEATNKVQGQLLIWPVETVDQCTKQRHIDVTGDSAHIAR